MYYNSIIVVLDEVLVSTISGNDHPCGIWDWKIVWPLWNALKYNTPQRLMIISNDDCVKKGVIQDDSYWSKICFISHCLRDYTKIGYVDYSYSINADWLDINGDIMALKAVSQNTLLIGKSEEDQKHSETLGTDYIGIDELLDLINRKQSNNLFNYGKNYKRDQIFNDKNSNPFRSNGISSEKS